MCEEKLYTIHLYGCLEQIATSADEAKELIITNGEINASFLRKALIVKSVTPLSGECPQS
jgi:hypothetical protein